MVGTMRSCLREWLLWGKISSWGCVLLIVVKVYWGCFSIFWGVSFFFLDVRKG